MAFKAGVLLLVACVVVAGEASQSKWNQGARDHILEIHNYYRRNEGGCQINKLQYDQELENQAKVWAERCVFKHEMKIGRGENLAYSTYQNPENEMISSSAQGWFDEKKAFRTGQRGCQRSCHYTQLVWHDTQKVGCYSTRCPYLQGANAQNAWYFVCFYTPMGNWIGQQPYQTQCDAPCKPGQTQDNGLCVGDAVKECTDGNASCASWASRGECERNPNYMMTNCKKSCNQCW